MASVHEFFGATVQLYLRPRSPFWWCSTTINGARFRHSTRKEDYEQALVVAEAWALNLKGVERWGGGIRKPQRSFKVAAEQWLEAAEVLTQGERSARYIALHRSRLRNHLLPFFGNDGIADITAGRIDEYRVHRLKVGPMPRGGHRGRAHDVDTPRPAGRRLGRSTLHQEIVCLRQVLKAEVRRGTLHGLPDMTMPHKLSGKVGHRAWFSPEEYRTLYGETRRRTLEPPRVSSREGYEDLHDCILFLANTGLRPDEAMRLEVRDVAVEYDEHSRDNILSINVRGKVGFGPCKSMPGAVHPFERLTQRLAARAGLRGKTAVKRLPQDTRLFPKLHRDLLNSVLLKLGMKNDREGRPRTFYSLRHTYICMRLLDGANAYELGKNCRTSVEMIQEHYAVHLKNYIDTSLVNVRRKKSKALSLAEVD